MGVSLEEIFLQNAIDEQKGKQLLEIEEDNDYIDPEVTDDEEEASVPKFNYRYSENKEHRQKAASDSADVETVEEATESILSKG